MPLSDKNQEILKGVLLSRQGLPLKIMMAWMDEEILAQEKKTAPKGNLLDDIPFFYEKEGKIKMLKSLRSKFEGFERQEKEDAEKPAGD